MLWLKFLLFKHFLRTLPIDNVEDVFYRATVLERNESRRAEMWSLITKLWYRHPVNKELRKAQRKLYDKIEKEETGRY